MTAELFEFPDEMRLVGIAAQVCELGVADAFGGVLQNPQRFLKTDNPCVFFGVRPHIVIEQAFKLFGT